ncbi:transposase [Rugamonas sp. CCM 8940]|uniref:transposase n=1 Tax=Rugamonas sp. CCM 8940 TaxID=2765359 RepID=UPI0018F280F7|nr:transposase [Rugamonas sp. CCM 8940]MBJ7312371.1 transposase [Rugamonas sp. CCM 8940]
MPRHARLVLPEVPLHIIQRGNNRQPCFFADEDYLTYLGWLNEQARQIGCRVHAYVLMTNHVHLLLTAADVGAPAALMKILGQRYVQYINWRYRRSGSLWEGRYKAALVQDEAYLLLCHRYIEMNPVRAGLSDYPGQYRWSSYRANAEGRADAIVEPHAIYQRLGVNAASRRLAYQALFATPLQQRHVNNIRRATNGDFGLGNQAFLRWLADARRQNVG